jgi:hypothetical protein
MTVYDLSTPRLVVACEKCDRRGFYSVERLWRERGDIKLTDFLAEVTTDCPRAIAAAFHDRCAARFIF